MLPESTRRVLLSKARWLYNNVGFVKGAVTDIARYSVGIGFIPQSQIKDESVRAAYEDYWRNWSNICEVTGKLTYTELLRLVSIAVDVDGDIGLALTETVNGFPRLQLVESHRIESNRADVLTNYDGVYLNVSGAPIGYSIRNGEQYQKQTYSRINARDFALIMEMDRCDEVRGKTRLHAAINRLIDVWETIEAETQAIKTNSKIAMAIETDDDTTKPFLGKQTVTGSGQGAVTVEDIYAGTIPKLRRGEKLWAHKTERPSPTFTGYLDYIARDVASGLGVPVEFVWDSSKIGGATQRFILQKAQRRFEERQATLCKLSNRIWGWVVSKAVKAGDLPYSEDWWRIRWQTPAKITVDVGREAQQAREDILLGIRTVAEDAAERGLDWQEMRDQSEREAADLLVRADRLSKTSGKSFDLCMSLLQQRNKGGAAPFAQPIPEQ